MKEIDIKQLTDEELDDLRISVLNEKERRQRLADIPQQVKALAAAYESDGGDKTVLVGEIGVVATPVFTSGEEPVDGEHPKEESE